MAVVSDCGSGTKVIFVGTESGCRSWLKFVGTAPGDWVIIVGSVDGVWVRSVNSGHDKGVRFVCTSSGWRCWLKIVGTASGAWESAVPLTAVWARFEVSGTGTRLEFRSKVARPAESVISTRVLPTSGDSTETGLVGMVIISEVLVKLKVSRGLLATGLLEELVVGVEGPDIGVSFELGLISGPSFGPSMLIIWMEGSVALTAFGLESVLRLQVLTIGVHGARSRCFFNEDVVPTGKATSVTGEDPD